MELRNYVKVYDNVIPPQTMGNMIRWFNTCGFTSGSIGQGVLDKNVRNVQTKPLTNLGKSLTEAHWCNLLNKFFSESIRTYAKDTNIKDLGVEQMTSIEILKYEVGGHYDFHVDHFAAQPRTMSMILLCNNDYEGGELGFANPDRTDELIVPVRPNRLIVWPSNFLFPHGVKPITKGIRYSVVGWAL
jgi:hypothetical protein|tara:strand:- start:977 stop:1537 length:561 start_codon:yes stop_codon:yes gene_type:complete